MLIRTCFLSFPLVAALEGNSPKYDPREGQLFLVRVVKSWNKLPTFVEVGERLARSLYPSSPLTEISPPQSSSPRPIASHPLIVPLLMKSPLMSSYTPSPKFCFIKQNWHVLNQLLGLVLCILIRLSRFGDKSITPFSVHLNMLI